jgi:anti-sigma factor RsiW
MTIDSSGQRPILEEELHAFADGLLDPDRRAVVQDYLDRQPEAAAQVDRIKAQRGMLREAFRPIAEEPVPSRLNLERLVEEAAVRRHSAPMWRMAAVVLLTFGLGSAGGWMARGQSKETSAGIASLSREASASYAVYALDSQRPVEIDASHKTELATWVSSRLERRVPIPDLERSGFTLVGGRLVVTEHGPAALFMYDNQKGTRLAVLARPMAIQKDTGAMQPTEGRYPGYSWADRGLGYSVVADDRTESLHRVADEVRRQVLLSL